MPARKTLATICPNFLHMNASEFILYYVAMVATLATTLVLLLRGTISSRWIWAVAGGGIACFAALVAIQFQIPYDYKLFWLCGRDVLAGIDYYAIDPRAGRQMVLNPPTALPLFELFASFPLRKGAKVWTVVNAIASLSLVPLAYRVVQTRLGDVQSKLAPAILGILTAVLVLSQACLSNLALGQLSIFTTLAILLALSAQDRNRPVAAGVWLTLASVKVVTMLPFLLLFTKRRDLPTWLTMACLGLGLCLWTGRPMDLPRRLENNIGAIQAMAEPGRVNDYSYEGPSHTSMIAVDHAFYRMGLRDRGQIAVLQVVFVGLLGFFVAKAVRNPRCSRAAAVSLVSLYAAVFLYHRIYDALILVAPLVYCVGLARNLAPRQARPAALCAASIIVTLSAYQRFLVIVESTSFEQGAWGSVLQAVVLPVSTWSVLLSIACLYAVGRRRILEFARP